MARRRPTSGGVGVAPRPRGWRFWPILGLILAILVITALYLEIHSRSQTLQDQQEALLRSFEVREAALREELREEVDRAVRKASLQADLLEKSMIEGDRVLRDEASSLKEALERVDRQNDRSLQDLATLEEEIATLGSEVHLNRPTVVRFKEVQQENEPSLFFVYSEVGLRRIDGEVESTIATYGTGFALTEDGHIATSKHVAQPWKFREFARQMRLEGLIVDTDSYLIAAWPAGSRIIDPVTDRMNLGEGFNNQRLGNLRVWRAARDNLRTEVITSRDGEEIRLRYHNANDNHDLVILKASGERLRPVRMLPAAPPEKLDPVMVLGFPRGLDILEKGVAESSPSLGTVRKVEETIYVTASIIPGNSGGPIFDVRGNVVGVAARVIQGTETLGIALRADHLLDLLAAGEAPPVDLSTQNFR